MVNGKVENSTSFSFQEIKSHPPPRCILPINIAHIHPTEKDSILFFDWINRTEIQYFHALGISKIDVFLWNTFKESSKYLLIDKRIRVHTFDSNDSINYGFNLLNQVYRIPDICTESTIKYDFFFIGADKGRYKALDYLSGMLRKKGYTVKCIVVNPDKKCMGSDNLELTDYYIPYVDVLKYIAQSHVLIDFGKIGQVGLTLRIMEGLFFNKKVLTNNQSIKNYSFYRPNRFFVYEGPNLLGIDDWTKTPMSEYNELEVLPYDIKNWIRTFL